MTKSYSLGLLLLLGLLAGCTQNLFQTSAKKFETFPVDAAYEYRIRKDDKLSVSVWDHEELSVGSIYSTTNSNEESGKWLLVAPDGNINLPKIGAFPVAGLTVTAAETNLKKALGKSIVNPQLNIKVLNKEVTVLGEVNAPGQLPLEKERNTLVEIVGRAGDLNVYADKKHVRVMRPDGATVREMEIDLTRLDQFAANNILVLPGDVVYVPARSGKQFDKKSGTSLAITSAITAVLLITRIAIGL